MERTDQDYLSACSTTDKDQKWERTRHIYCALICKGEKTHPLSTGHCSQISGCCQLVCCNSNCILPQKWMLLCGTRLAVLGITHPSNKRAVSAWADGCRNWSIQFLLDWSGSFHTAPLLNYTQLSNTGKQPTGYLLHLLWHHICLGISNCSYLQMVKGILCVHLLFTAVKSITSSIRH